MPEKLVCDRCGETYTDAESIQSAKEGLDDWKAICERDGDTPRGLAPCPIWNCKGELILKTE